MGDPERVTASGFVDREGVTFEDAACLIGGGPVAEAGRRQGWV
jgi:hypothetical protein